MPEPFAQPERRSFLLPIALALVVLAIAAAVTIHLFPATQVQATHIQTVLHSEDTLFKSNSIVLGSDHTEQVLYIASTIRVDNRLRLPITLEAFTLTFTNPDEAQLTANSLTKPELANIELTYPALKPLLATPLLPETTLAPAQSTQGTLLFALPIPESMWNERKSAVIQITPYHPDHPTNNHQLTTTNCPMRRRWIADTYTPDPNSSGNAHPTHAALLGDQALHLARVLRAEPGQIFDVVAAGFLHRAEVLTVSPDRVDFLLHEELASDAALPLHLYLAIFKFDHFEWAIEKATELGVSQITPILAHRTEKHLAQAAAKRAERWRRIAHEAAQQSRRTTIPAIAVPTPLKPALALEQAPTRILLSETEQTLTLSQALGAPGSTALPSTLGSQSTHALAIGPEGGWTPEEMSLFTTHNWTPVTLGPRILRAETAAIAAIAIAGTFLSSPRTTRPQAPAS